MSFSSTWGTKKSDKKPKQGYGISNYSHGIKKQNSKEYVGTYGEHKWYNPRTGQMGSAGKNYPGKKRKPFWC